jgi:hypothetical protein
LVNKHICAKEVHLDLFGCARRKDDVKVVSVRAAFFLEATPHLADLGWSFGTKGAWNGLLRDRITDVKGRKDAACPRTPTAVACDALVAAAGIRPNIIHDASWFIKYFERRNKGMKITYIPRGTYFATVRSLRVDRWEKAAARKVDFYDVAICRDVHLPENWETERLLIYSLNWTCTRFSGGLVASSKLHRETSHIRTAQANQETRIFKQMPDLRDALRTWLSLFHVARVHSILRLRFTTTHFLIATTLGLLHSYGLVCKDRATANGDGCHRHTCVYSRV